MFDLTNVKLFQGFILFKKLYQEITIDILLIIQCKKENLSTRSDLKHVLMDTFAFPYNRHHEPIRSISIPNRII